MTAAVLLMAYGTPRTLEDVRAYFTHIRGGRAPSDRQAEELRARYLAIGGTSPLRTITFAQAARLQATLRERGVDAAVEVGMKHAPPFIAEVVAAMASRGIRSAVALPLAPHYSRLSTAGYLQAATDAAGRAGLALRTIEAFHDHPGFVAAVAARLREAVTLSPEAAVIFTAHSLPQRILTWNDPYPDQLRRTCELVSRAAGVAAWRFAYQSVSATGEPWLGPDLSDTLAQAADEGAREVVVCPVGFVADHLEVLYDIDVEAAALAAGLGVRLRRTASLNDAADFAAALADLVLPALRAAEGVA